ncbi:hypothetical protein [Hymenobacter sediminicola]|uniref:Uncharacterized protein n=1 Tax=Hymenobacter sediminicola TaxID=2761579 RepID=A0A7G7W5I5_9BACT|nr:hypothetical protein [Hymenobacter sediminicola]QNH61628.1 hypothetical protein H4317_15910 [Hymenobacter sediminicola]
MLRSILLMILAGVAFLSSCVAYSPMQPAISTIRKAGEVELTTSLQHSIRLEAGAVYSPISHLLLSGTGAVRPRGQTVEPLGTLQGEVGLGTYWALGPQWQINGLMGYGRAVSNQNSLDVLGSNTLYRAHYHKLYGQVSGVCYSTESNAGFVYRLSQVRFDALDYFYPAEAGAIPISRLLYHEALWFYRHKLGQQTMRWHWQIAGGFSVPQGRRQKEPEYGPDKWAIYEANRNLSGVPMLSMGIVFQLGNQRKSKND